MPPKIDVSADIRWALDEAKRLGEWAEEMARDKESAAWGNLAMGKIGEMCRIFQTTAFAALVEHEIKRDPVELLLESFATPEEAVSWMRWCISDLERGAV